MDTVEADLVVVGAGSAGCAVAARLNHLRGMAKAAARST